MYKSEQLEHCGRYMLSDEGAGSAIYILGFSTVVGAAIGNGMGAAIGGAVGAVISELLDKKTWSCCGKKDLDSKCKQFKYYEVCRICDQMRIYTNRCRNGYLAETLTFSK